MRRSFMFGVSGLAVYLLFHQFLSRERDNNLLQLKKKLIISGFTPELKKVLDSKYVNDFRFPGGIAAQIVIHNLQDHSHERYATPFFGHSFFSSDERSNWVAASEKWGLRAGLFDLQTKKTIQTFAPADQFRFFGHGVFFANGERIAFTGNSDDDTKGFVAVYEVQSGKLLDLLPSYGSFPHDCYLSADKKSLIVANSKSDNSNQSSIVTLDLQSGKLKTQFLLPSQVRAAHLHKLSESLLSCGAVFRKKKLPSWSLINLKSQQVIDFAEVAKRHNFSPSGEALSLGSFGDNILFTTLNWGKQILIWNFQSDRIARKDFDDGIFGLVFDKESLYITTSSGKLISLKFNAENFDFENQHIIDPDFGNSSHILLM